MNKRKPVAISRKTHRRIVVLLLLLAVGIVFVTRDASKPSSVPAERSPAGNATGTKPDSRSGNVSAAPSFLELPFCEDDNFLIRNEAGRYTLRYDTSGRQAAWVAYVLTRAEVRTKGAKRRNIFRCDPEVLARGWPSATDRDYAGSGFDRGHLLPSADRDDTPAENGATFLLSNIAPQRAVLNRRAWRLLEEQVRRWAGRYDSLYIVTGGALGPSPSRIGDGVAVPSGFYKTVLARCRGRWQAVAFLIPHSDTVSGRFFDYAMCIDSLEKRLGMDFYPALPDSIERRVERQLDPFCWK